MGAETHDVTSITLALKTLGSFDFEGRKAIHFFSTSLQVGSL